jgi:tetratricopeptide (TPR) repeat protein
MVQMNRVVSSKFALLLVLSASGATGACQSHRGPEARVASIEPGAGSADKLTAQGRDALRQGDPTRAEQYFTLALEQGGDQAELVRLLVQTCMAQSRVRAALNYADPYLIEHPEELALRYLVATIHLSLGHDKEAHRQLVILTRRAPKYSDAHFLLGVIFERAERLVASRRAFEEYLTLAPEGKLASETRHHLQNLEFEMAAYKERESGHGSDASDGSVVVFEEYTTPARATFAPQEGDAPATTKRSTDATTLAIAVDQAPLGGEK